MNNSDSSVSTRNHLEELLAKVLGSPPHSKARAKNLSHLIRYLQHLPGIRKVNHQDYLLALNQTWEWLSREIDKFQRSNTGSLEDELVKWINGYLYWRIHDLYFPQKTTPLVQSLDTPVSDTDITYLDLLSEDGFIEMQLSSLDRYIEKLQQQENQSIVHQLEVWIALDPEGELQGSAPKGCPGCNCQILSGKLLLQDPPDSLTKIALELEIPYQTLVSHWKRNCLKLLQNKAKNLEYDN
jgi:hypothetical protein